MKKLKKLISAILACALIFGSMSISVNADEDGNALAFYDFEIENPVYKYHGTGAVKSEGDPLATYIDQYGTGLCFIRPQQEKGQLFGIVDDEQQGKSVSVGLGGYGGGLGIAKKYKANTAYLFSSYVKANPQSPVATRKIALLPLFANGYGKLSNAKMFVFNNETREWLDQSEARDTQFKARPDALFENLERTNSEWKKVERVFVMTADTSEYIGLSYDGVWNQNAFYCFMDDIKIEKLFYGIEGLDEITVIHGQTRTQEYSINAASDISGISETVQWSVKEDNPYVTADKGILTVEPCANTDSVTLCAKIPVGDGFEEFEKVISIIYDGEPMPYIKNAKIEGEISPNETVTAVYDYIQPSGVDEDASEIEWLVSDFSDEGYSLLENSKTLLLKDEYLGKWIKARITPKDKSGHINPTAVETSPISLPAPPKAENVRIEGKSETGNKLIGKYDYTDLNDNGKIEDEKEDGSVYAWYRSDKADGTYEKIEGENSTEYTLTSEDCFKFLRFGVIPKNKAPLGDNTAEFLSEPFKCPTAPEARDLKITGTGKLGSTLLGEYTYWSEFGTPEGESVYEWYLNGELYSNEISVTVKEKMNGKTLTLSVTPVAKYEPCKGETVTATKKISFSSKNYSSSGGGGGGGTVSSGGGNSVIAEPKPDNTQNPVNPTEPEKTALFKDIENHWAKADITAMAEKKLINGYGDETFLPDSFIKRSEAAAIIVRALNIADGEATMEFTDVKPDDWFYDAVMKTASNEITGGYNGSFRPNDYITRQEFAVMAYKACQKYKNADFAQNGSVFSDDAEISEWAREAVYKLCGLNIVTGYDNSFSPTANITRAEACVITERILNLN